MTRAAQTSRRGRTVALGGTAALALVVGTLLGATASNAETMPVERCVTTSGATSLVDFGGATPAKPSAGGLTGSATGADGSSIGLLTCDTESVSRSASRFEVLSGTAATTTTDGTAASQPAGPADALDAVKLARSAMVVYPAATGYQDTVNFSIRGVTAAEHGIRITGTAALSKGSELVETWPIDGAATRLTWDGHVAGAVEAGLYTLTASAWSADGTTRTSSMSLVVSAAKLVTRTVTVRTGDLAKAVTDDLPAKVIMAFKYGPVTLRIHTKAKVTGRAKIVITVVGAGSYAVPLRNGTHVTGPIPLYPGYPTARFSHDWKKRDATLQRMYTVFTYQQLV